MLPARRLLRCDGRGGGACAKKPPAHRPADAAAAATAAADRTAARSADAGDRAPARAARAGRREDSIAARDIDDINKNSPFQPVFFAFGQRGGRRDGAAGAERQRGDHEEVPDLGDHHRRALRRARHGRVQSGARRAAGRRRAHLSRLARHSGDRLRTVSYGKEFPFDPGHDEAAWAKNRRAQFVVTSK